MREHMHMGVESSSRERLDEAPEAPSGGRGDAPPAGATFFGGLYLGRMPLGSVGHDLFFIQRPAEPPGQPCRACTVPSVPEIFHMELKLLRG